MRWMFVFLALAASVWATRGQAADFPYKAVVNSTDVYVRSGPGRDYYPTDKVQKGETVEVWRHDPGGWYAIRPPRQSFSWISARHLDSRGENLAEVNTPRAVARVGSAFSDARDIIQVRLDKGEVVALLEPARPDSPWCKISPPSGEFRWVFSKYLERGVPNDVVDDPRDAATSLQFATGTGPLPPDEPIDAQPRSPQGPLDANDAVRAIQVAQEINRLELELSAQVAGEVNTWDFTELNRRAQAVFRQTNSTVERGRARLLLDKLARFDDIRQRHDSLRQEYEVRNLGREKVVADGVHVDLSRFDGVGRLSPVISEKAGGPQYALVDQSKQVISFITPAPGVNLRPFVDHYVGVNGQMGYLTELQRHHINVQRVSLLEVERR